MSNIYNNLCATIENGDLIEIQKITESIIHKSDPDEIKLIYDSYNSDKAKFRALFQRDALLTYNKNFTNSDISYLQSMLDHFIASILVIHQDLFKTEQYLKRKNDELHPDEPLRKKSRVSHEQDVHAANGIKIYYDQILSNLNFLPNQISTIIENSRDLAVDVQYIVTLIETYKMSPEFIYSHFMDHLSLSRLHNLVINLSELRLSTEDQIGFSLDQIYKMLKNYKVYANSLFLVSNWDQIKLAYFTLDEIEKIVIRYDTSMIKDIFFYLGELREKKCLHLHVIKISEKTIKGLLTLLYQNFDKFKEYGWYRIENLGRRELSSILNKINTMQEMMEYLDKNPVGQRFTLAHEPNSSLNQSTIQTNVLPFDEKQLELASINTYAQPEPQNADIYDYQPLQQYTPDQNDSTYTPSAPYYSYQNSNPNPYFLSPDYRTQTAYSALPHQPNYMNSTYNCSYDPTVGFYQTAQPQMPDIVPQIQFNTVNYYPITINTTNTYFGTPTDQTITNYSGQVPLAHPNTQVVADAQVPKTHSSELQRLGFFKEIGTPFTAPVNLLNNFNHNA